MIDKMKIWTLHTVPEKDQHSMFPWGWVEADGVTFAHWDKAPSPMVYQLIEEHNAEVQAQKALLNV